MLYRQVIEKYFFIADILLKLNNFFPTMYLFLFYL